MSAKRRKRPAKVKKAAVKPKSEAMGSPSWAVTSVLMASAAFGSFGSFATPLFAQDSANPPVSIRIASRQFDISAGSLAAALQAFSKATGITVTDPKGLVGELQSPGLTGTFSDEDALRQLLTGRGLTYRFTNAKAIRLEPLSADAATVLPSIAVNASRPAVSSPKYTEPVRDIPQSITVIPQDVIQSQGATTLRDVVRNVPGLTVNAGEGGATPGDNFNLRGFSARSDIFVDGVRANGGYTREMFNVEQVEVTKGPASSYIGRGSTGGAINMVTKIPTLRQAYTGIFGVGTASYQQAGVDVNQPLERVGLPGVAVRVNANWLNAGVPGVSIIERNSWGVAPSLALGLGTPTQLVVEHFHAEQDNMPAYGVQSNNLNDAPPVETRRFFGLRSLDFEAVNTDRGSARLNHYFNESMTLRNQFTWANEEVNRIVTYTNLDGTRRSPSHISEDATIANQTTLAKTFTAGKTRHAVTAGLEFAREDSYFASYRFSAPLPTTDVNNPDPNQTYSGTISVAPPRRDATATSMGAYLLETAELSEKWEVSGSVRWDRFDPTYRDSVGNELTPHTTSEAVSWRAGLVYKPRENGSIYAAYGTSFNPSGERLAYDGTGTNGLDPEKNRSVEVGTKWDVFHDRLLFSASVFRTEKTNARMTDPNDPLGQTIILAGKQQVNGAELGASGRILSDWNLFAGYMWLDSEILTGNPSEIGRPLPNTPKHSLSLWSTYHLPGNFEIGGGTRHLSRRVTSATASVPPYWAFDAEASYAVGSRMLMRLNLMNLTDAKYYDNGRFWVPAAGRAVRLTTTFTY